MRRPIFAAVTAAFLLGQGGVADAQPRRRAPEREPAPTAAPAEPAGQLTAEQVAEARALFQQGQASYAAGEYEDAIAAWRRAYEIDPRAALQYNLAQAYGRLGDLDGELAALELFVAGTPESTSMVEMARQRIEGIRQRMTRTGIVLVGLQPGADVQIDGQPIATTPGERIALDAGTHRVRIRLRGHRPLDTTVDVLQGRSVEVPAELPPVREARPPFVAYTLLATGGAMLLTGAVTGTVGFMRSGDAFSGTSEADRVHRLGVATDVMLIGGGVAATTGLILYLVRDRGESDGVSDRATIAPFTSAGGGGLVLQGSF